MLSFLLNDNGLDFDLASAKKQGGIGLASMLEQAHLINGDLSMESEPHRGTTIKLNPDVIVVDISEPLLNGIEAVRQIRISNESIKVFFLTMHPDMF